eukprot:768221-Hanusia_phi.AAC.4
MNINSCILREVSSGTISPALTLIHSSPAQNPIIRQTPVSDKRGTGEVRRGRGELTCLEHLHWMSSFPSALQAESPRIGDHNPITFTTQDTTGKLKCKWISYSYNCRTHSFGSKILILIASSSSDELVKDRNRLSSSCELVLSNSIN